MANFESTIEALEHQWMRAWIARDRKAMKGLAVDRRFVEEERRSTPLEASRTHGIPP